MLREQAPSCVPALNKETFVEKARYSDLEIILNYRKHLPSIVKSRTVLFFFCFPLSGRLNPSQASFSYGCYPTAIYTFHHLIKICRDVLSQSTMGLKYGQESFCTLDLPLWHSSNGWKNAKAAGNKTESSFVSGSPRSNHGNRLDTHIEHYVFFMELNLILKILFL